MNRTQITMAAMAGCLAFSLSTSAFAQGQKKLMSVRAAEEAARRALVESITGLNMTSSAEVKDMVAGGFTVNADVDAAITRVEFVESTYDPEKDIAMVKAAINAATLTVVTDKKVDLGNRRFARIGFGTSTPASAPALQALRAAEIDAYRQLAEYFSGIKIVGKTTVKDYVLESDSIKATFGAALYGANLAAEDPFGFQDDTAYMKLTLTVGDVEDILGQKFEQVPTTTATVTGWGAIRSNDGTQAPGNTPPPTRTYTPAVTQTGTLNIPVQSATPPPPPAPPAPFGGVQSR